MSPTQQVRGRFRFLAALAVALLTAPAALASVFDVLPHFKKTHKPICNQYGDCFGHYQVTYRQWPGQCLLNPAIAPRVQPFRFSVPPPPAVPDEPPPEVPSAGPVSGILYEILQEPAPLAPAVGQATSPQPNRLPR